MRVKINRTVLVATTALVALIFATSSPNAAIASGYDWGRFYYTNVTQGETVPMMVIDGDMCPNVGVQDLAVEITDANSNIQSIYLQQTSSSGSFNAPYLNIPTNVSVGVANVVLTCSLGGVITRTFDLETIDVAAPSNEIQFSRTPNIWADVVISSETLCQSPGMAVAVEVNSVATAWNGSSYSYAATRHSNEGIAYPDSSGHWSLTLSLTPFVPGQTGYNEYVEGQTYSIRTFCMSQPYFEVEESPHGQLFTIAGDQYVHLGDSYSSGEGAFTYDLDASPCHRSTSSYAYSLVDTLGWDLPDFQACSGAVTDDFFNYDPELFPTGKQLDALSNATEFVSLTIGGNDVGFSEVVRECVHHASTDPTIGWSCGNNSSMMDIVEDRMDALSGPSTVAVGAGPGGRDIHSINSILSEIELRAPNAKIYLAGYPHLFGSSSSNYEYDGDAPGAAKCVVHDGFPEVSVSYWDALVLNNLADELNTILESAVDSAPSNIDVTFVDVVPSFEGHGLCDSGTNYINGVHFYPFNTSVQPESFHPNTQGMQYGYGSAFVDAAD